MPSRVPVDHVTGCNSVNGGIRQVLRSTPAIACARGSGPAGVRSPTGQPSQRYGRGGGEHDHGQGEVAGDRDDVEVGEQGGGHQDPRQQQQHTDDEAGDAR